MYIVHYSHNDLDNLGCMLNIRFKFPSNHIETFHTNYKNIYEVTHDCIDYCKKHEPKLLLITDISFAQERELLVELIDSTPSTKIVYLDHHKHPEGFFDNLDINYVHDVTKSATLITHEYFNNQGKSAGLDNITELIDTYDLWRVEHPRFKEALKFNDYYWHSVDTIYDNMIANSYGLPTGYQAVSDGLQVQADEAIERYYAKNLVHSDGTTSIIFADEFFTDVLVKEMELGRKVVVIANSYGIIRVRFNGINSLDTSIKESIKMDLMGSLDVGHENAFAMVVKKKNLNGIMAEIKRVAGIINHRIK